MLYRLLAVSLALGSLAACETTTPAGDAGQDAGAFDGGGEPRDGGADAGRDAPRVDTSIDAPPPPDEIPTLVFTDPPVDGLPEGVQFAEAIPYGTDPRQVIDVFLPDSDAPTAAVLYFHGGGFINGSRTNAYSGSASALTRVVSAGVAWIGVDYRLLDDPGTETEGVLKSLRDARRALQFVRRHAETFHIDPDRIGVHGSSAGAGTSLWLAYHDDMAVPDGEDVVGRESTRPNVAAVIETQATYDVMRWAPDVFGPEYAYVTNDLLLTQEPLRAMLVRFYGLDGALIDDPKALEAELLTPEMVTYRAECDLLELMTAEDPPSYVRNSGEDESPIAAGADLLHHPLHARTVHERSIAVGAELEADIPAFDVESDEEAIEFLLTRLAE